ncbi:Carbonic anhydrase or acetyltransferase, isoleucine patch superfamily [Clostridium cavendishii DSM 21758]|uniref:Carbonic anhydrase or acetyltransferase, isoleucine patch superfamily n=1 Tax=Clostridium cavendishii DSM 21758 TaxID=1121302 RepID=A0A1M6FHT3_9CLOT|nr:gamma carbonic anhydrase family protein [Clostridium cavendishii]SHI97199.1 Carbonic anhydrase or acetyltransferase, isoleucine patch superfamily [Clostridium cavendishii DSM 21758]
MILEFLNKTPKIDSDVFIAPSSDIIGDIEIEKDASIWFGAVLRGDVNKIKISRGVNVQDNSVIHVDEDYEVFIGENATIGHNAIIHGATIGNNSLIGMGAIILNGAKIGKNSIIAAGSLVPQNKEIPDGVLCMGSPAKVVRNLSMDEVEKIANSAKHYIKISKKYTIKS